MRKAQPIDSYHGTRTGFGRGCRCDRCWEAERVYKRTWAAARKGKAVETRDEWRARMAEEREQHGEQGYERGCRCDECRSANTRRTRRRRHRGVPDDELVPCPECGERMKVGGGLNRHRASVHDVHVHRGGKRYRARERYRERRGIVAADPCPECGELLVGRVGLAVHRRRMHGSRESGQEVA